MKKGLILAFICILLVLPLISAQEKISISLTKESFKADEKINLKVTLLDSNNNPLNEEVKITLQDASKTQVIEETIKTNEKFVEISLGENPNHGNWEAIVFYGDSEAKEIFNIEINEVVEFTLEEDKLIITNIGNSKYSKQINIRIGNTLGVKNPQIEKGKSVEYRLIAPEGVYDIKVTDDTTTLLKENVPLTGTGNVVGALDESGTKKNVITGGLKPEEGNSITNYLKRSWFSYVFILVIVGAAILLAVERRYSKKAGN